MARTDIAARQGRRLLQTGVGLILFSACWGFVIPHAGSQRIALSVHTLSAFQGVLLLAQGLLWRRLRLGASALRVAFWGSLYGAFAILAAYMIAASKGIGLETIALAGELPHGLARGTPLQEAIVKAIAYSSAPAGLASYGLIFWGLRGAPEQEPAPRSRTAARE